MFHCKILTNPGLNSTLYAYLYFYKIKSHLIGSLDILSIKIFSLISSVFNIGISFDI